LKDRRITYARSVLGELVESLDATVRIGRWSGGDVPTPLRENAALLVDRLGKANRLAASRFAGAPRSAAEFSALSVAIQRLDRAFVGYRSMLDRAEGERMLEAEIATVRAEINLDAPA
jgi:hypothetical protein